MKKEHSIYKKVASGVNRGVIVKCHGYVPEVEERPGKSALILERGVRDLKEHRRWHGLNGDALKEALYSVNQCMESFHGARLVWTDMKTENFVIVEDETSGEHSVKAIDLESAMNVKENPIDYTPEATPPEFAKAFVSGDPHSFVLDFSFDVWSFGMLAYELATGVGYFDGNSPDAIMQKLSQNNVPNTSIGIEDDDLADLISQSLSLDPKKRPSAQKISRHPYFSSVSKPALFQLW
jgi:serine/threonine protein kinase